MTSMQTVAHHLSCVAKSRSSDEADAFGRAAFNRYYYAAFLSTRQLLSCVERSWARSPHSAIPDLLEQSLTKKLISALKRLEKNGLIAHGKAESLVSQARTAAGETSSILHMAYKVRVIADYEPEEKVSFELSTFCLATHTEAEAKQWLARIERNKGILLRVAKEVGLV
jgi:hypothetical protein